MASMNEQRYGVGDIVILDDGSLAKVTEVFEQFGEWYYEVEPRGEGAVPILTEVEQDEIQGMA